MDYLKQRVYAFVDGANRDVRDRLERQGCLFKPARVYAKPRPQKIQESLKLFSQKVRDSKVSRTLRDGQGCPSAVHRQEAGICAALRLGRRGPGAAVFL